MYGSAAASGTVAGAGVAAYYGSTIPPAAVGYGLLFAIAAVPALATAGIYRSHVNKKIDEEISKRASTFPVKVPAGQNYSLDLFFPVAPSPKSVEIIYSYRGNQYSLAIDTTESLKDLHLPPSVTYKSANEDEFSEG